MFKLFKKKNEAQPSDWYLIEDDRGLSFGAQPFERGRALKQILLGAFLDQLEEEGLASRRDDGFFVSWDSVYEILEHREHSQAALLLDLPSQGTVRVTVSSKDSLEDNTFDIAVGGWHLDDRPARGAFLNGAILEHEDGRVLLPSSLWSVVREVRAFATRADDERNGNSNRQAWGRIRRLAVMAGAGLDDFLHRTVVLTPEKLAIAIRKVEIDDDKVIEVQPSFDGAPADWLDRFDRHATVQDRYDIPTSEGIVQVVVSPKVRTVLEEIKRLPLRRVAGARAQAFILNPYAALGEDASAVIDEQQFEQARAAAGLGYERFLPQFERDAFGYPIKAGLLIETASSSGPTSSEHRWLTDDDLAGFVRLLQRAIDKNFQLLAWDGYDLELQGDTPEHLRLLTEALEARRRPPIVISYAQVLPPVQIGVNLTEFESGED